MIARHPVAAVGLSAAFNAGIVASLAYIGELEVPEDLHAAHMVRPSVVEPPPPPPSSADHASAPNPSPAAAQLPAKLEPPPLALPPMANASAAFPNPLSSGGADWVFDRGFGGLIDEASRRESALPSQPPQIARMPDLSRYYPRTAQQNGVTGRSIIQVEVNARGVVGRVEVLRSDPPGVFEAAARRAGRAFRFEPALEHGRSVRATTRVELVWSRS